MLKNISQIEFKIGEKIYHFTCDQDAPLEHVKEVLFQLLKFVGQIEDQIKSMQNHVQSESIKEEIKSE